MLKIVKQYPILGSSVDPTKLSLTIKGLLVGITPLVLTVAGIYKLNLGEETWAQIVEVIVQLVNAHVPLIHVGFFH